LRGQRGRTFLSAVCTASAWSTCARAANPASVARLALWCWMVRSLTVPPGCICYQLICSAALDLSLVGKFAPSRHPPENVQFRSREADKNITECSGLEGTSVGHLVQPPCWSRVTYSRLHIYCLMKELNVEYSLCSVVWVMFSGREECFLQQPGSYVSHLSSVGEGKCTEQGVLGAERPSFKIPGYTSRVTTYTEEVTIKRTKHDAFFSLLHTAGSF